ncbi:MAG: hypothetical protein ACK5TP_02050, partial [bacterium]
RQPRPNTDAIPVTMTARFIVRGRERAASASESVEQTAPPGRVPRVARLMALAIRFDSLLREGSVSTQAELAAVGHVTRARVTQIMNLLHLAPDIQEAILNMPPVMSGRDPFGEHELRSLVSMVEWPRQREAWRALTGVRITPAADR